MSLVNI